MRARILALAALLIAAAYFAADERWPLGLAVALAVIVAAVGERLLAPLSPLERAHAPHRPPLGLSTGPVPEGLRLTGRVLLVAIPVCVLLASVSYLVLRAQGYVKADFEHRAWMVASAAGARQWFWGAVIVAPIAEEIIWRGLIQQHLTRALGVRAAIVLSGLLFWIMHWFPAGHPTPINQLMGGWLIAWTYARSRGDLLAPILLHAIGNLAIGCVLLWILA